VVHDIVEVNILSYDPGTVNNLVDSALVKDVVAILEVNYNITSPISNPSIAPMMS